MHADAGPPSDVHLRPLRPSDLPALRAAHQELFPLDYEEAFFQAAVRGDEGTVSVAAVTRHGREEQLAGFITARLSPLRECNPADRAVLGLSSRFHDGQRVLYILTVGVLAPLRQRGLGSALLAAMLERGAKLGACTAFLHVIEYNSAAIAFYRRQGFRELALLPEFYYIGTGRQPVPQQTMYGAYLYAHTLRSPGISCSPLSCVDALLTLLRGLLTQLAWWQPGRSWRVWRMRSLVGVQKSGDVEMGSDFGHRAAKPL